MQHYRPVVSYDILYKLGFNYEDISFLEYLLAKRKKITPQYLSSLGLTFPQIERVRYLYSIIIGKIVIDLNNIDEVSHHLQKINRHLGRININCLPPSKFNHVPQLVVVNGIPEGKFDIYNFESKRRFYKLWKEDRDAITIKTKLKPKIPYGSSKCLYYYRDLIDKKMYFTEDRKELESILKKDKQNKVVGIIIEIKGITEDKKEVFVSINKKYVRKIRPFIIAASLTMPERHLGMYRIVSFEGSIIYVYAAYSDSEILKNNGSKRFYHLGFNKRDLKPALEKIARDIYNKLGCVNVDYQEGIEEYKIIEK